MVNPILVPAVSTDDQRGPVVFLAVTKKFNNATQTLREPPAIQKSSVNSNQGNNTKKKFLEASLRLSAHCKYNNYLKEWTSYSKNIGHIEASHVFNFLSRRFDKRHTNSTIDSAKCAIATIVHILPHNSLNKHPLINKYMTGVFNWRPPKRKLSFVWDVFLFRYFELQGENNLLSEKILTQKLLIFILLLGAHRISIVKLFSMSNMVLNDLSLTFIPTEVSKHIRKGTPLDKFKYRSYASKKLYITLGNVTRQDKHVGLNWTSSLSNSKSHSKGHQLIQ